MPSGVEGKMCRRCRRAGGVKGIEVVRISDDGEEVGVIIGVVDFLENMESVGKTLREGMAFPRIISDLLYMILGRLVE